MKNCKISNCKGVHEAKGYCKRHYRSLMKHGSAEQVDINKAITEKNKARRIGRNYSTDGICSVSECQEPIKARRLCETHYARQRRTGSTKLTVKRLNQEVENCIVIGCGKKNHSAGFCSKHKSYNQKFGSPYIPRTIRLCGVGYCEEIHLAKGMCKRHYYEWGKVLEKYGLD